MSKRLDMKLRRVYSAPGADMRYKQPSTRVKDALALLDRIVRTCKLQWNASVYLDGSRLRYDAGWGRNDDSVSTRSLPLTLARLANDPRAIESYKGRMEKLKELLGK